MTNCTSPASISLIEAIKKDLPDCRQRLLQKFERGLKYLIIRICPAFVEECFSATVDEALAAVRTQRVLTEEALPSFIRQTARQIAGTFPSVSIAEEDPSFNPQVILAMQQKLTIFTPVQREALCRYYVQRESPDSICEVLGIDIEQFGIVRKVARQALGLRFNELTQPAPLLVKIDDMDRCGATSLITSKWKARATDSTSR